MICNFAYSRRSAGRITLWRNGLLPHKKRKDILRNVRLQAGLLSVLGSGPPALHTKRGNMKRFFCNTLCLFIFSIVLPVAAQAASKATFVVLPFAVSGPQGFAYLERSVPQMLTSRLYWKDRVEPAVNETPASQKPATSESEAAAAASKYKADYVIWGTVTVAGDDCSLDVFVRDRSGKVRPYAREAKTTQMIAGIKGVSDAINKDVFGRKPEASSSSASATRGGPERVNRMNPELIINEDTPKDVYLNPQFRYAGDVGDGSRLRSQTVAITAIGMEVTDADGDGRNEIFLLSEHGLSAFRMEKGARLTPLGEFKFPSTTFCLAVRSMPHGGGGSKLVVSMVDRDKRPSSSILSFNGNTFTEEARGIKYFLNVVKLPPDYRPILIGQAANPPKLFRPGGVSEMVKSGGSWTTGPRLNLPENVNVFNFTYLPAGRGEENAEKLVVLNSNERLVTYTTKGARLAESPESYSGAAVGLEVDPRMPGMGEDTVTERDMFYIPMRMPAVDLNDDGNWEIIVNRPISTASTIFDRYRFFPQSEIHSMQWDGVGLNLVWKTRRIKGSVVDYAIIDADNDGARDLVVCINTHPGALGVEGRKAIVLLYPLDLSKTSAPTSKDDIYE